MLYPEGMRIIHYFGRQNIASNRLSKTLVAFLTSILLPILHHLSIASFIRTCEIEEWCIFAISNKSDGGSDIRKYLVVYVLQLRIAFLLDLH